MDIDNDDLTQLYNAKGELLGVLISAGLWRRHEGKLSAILKEAMGPVEEEPRPEPLKDWESLKSFWDFKYPVDTDVRCDLCNNSTEDWTGDEPRKFRLMAANLGGLVRFECQQCRARVTKRHFKDRIQSETKPYLE